MLTRNGEIVTSNNEGIKKKHIKNTLRVQGWFKRVFLGQKGAPKDIEDAKYDIGRHQGHTKIHRRHWGHYGQKCFRVFQTMNGIKGHWEAQ